MRTQQFITPALEDALVVIYQSGVSAGETAKRIGASRQSVLNHLRARGVQMRSASDCIRLYTLNEAAFETRSPEMAYWLGFIVTDGCIYHPKTRKRVSPRLQVSIGERDRTHLEKFRAFMGSNAPIYHSKGSTSYAKPDAVEGRCTIRGGPSVKVLYPSRQLIASLEALGVRPRKSTCETVPVGFEDDVDFWRGVIDGDGWLTYDRQGVTSWTVTVGLCGSHDLCEGFGRFAAGRLGCETPNLRKEKKIWYAKINGRKAIELVRLLYASACCSLDRKAAKAIEILGIDWPERTPSPCSIEGCDRSASYNGMCTMHLKRVRRHGSPFVKHRAAIVQPRLVCTSPGCDRDRHARGLCALHYRRTRDAQ